MAGTIDVSNPNWQVYDALNTINAVDRKNNSTGSRTSGTGAASIINAVSGALSGLGNMIGTIITSVGTSRAIQSGNYSPYNIGKYNSNYVGIALIAVAAVGIIVIAKK